MHLDVKQLWIYQLKVLHGVGKKPYLSSCFLYPALITGFICISFRQVCAKLTLRFCLSWLKTSRWKKGKENSPDLREILIRCCSFCWRVFLLCFLDSWSWLLFWPVISSFQKTQHVLKLTLKCKTCNVEIEQQCAICWRCLIACQLCKFLCLHTWVVDCPR